MLGSVFTLGGLATLLVPGIPVICVGAIIFGPIMLVAGFMKMAQASRRPSISRIPPPYAPMPPVRSPPPAPPIPVPISVPGSAPTTGLACPKCGNLPPAGARFCNRCGAPIARS